MHVTTTTDQGDHCESSQPDEPASTEPPEPPAPPSAKRDTLDIDVCLQTDDTDPPACVFVRQYLQRICRHLELTDATISVAIVDDAQMIRLHDQYMNLPTSTDVLTFDLRMGEGVTGGMTGGASGGGGVEGDIAVCRDEAMREATVRGHDVRLELLLYAVHGVLHLLGFDDHDPGAAAAMHQREDELLTAVGLPTVYKEADEA